MMIAKPFAVAQLMHAVTLLLIEAERAITERSQNRTSGLKRFRAGHNRGGKSPVLAKSNRPPAPTGGAVTWSVPYEYFKKLNIKEQLCGR